MTQCRTGKRLGIIALAFILAGCGQPTLDRSEKDPPALTLTQAPAEAVPQVDPEPLPQVDPEPLPQVDPEPLPQANAAPDSRGPQETSQIELAGPFELPTDPVVLTQIDSGYLDQPQYAVAVLQSLFDQEYQAFMALDPKIVDPDTTLGWHFANADYEFLADLARSDSYAVGHSPAHILSVAQISALPTGHWELTVVTSELGLEIIAKDGSVDLDTRGNGPVMATYTIAHRNN